MNPPIWYINEPHIGPIRKPIPVAISIIPIFISRSDSFDVDTISASVATEFMPDPSPPIIWNVNDQNKNQFAL